MKDFKQTTKMRAEGRHYKAGGEVNLEEVTKAIRSGKTRDSMPSNSTGVIDIPGVGKARPTPMPKTGSADGMVDIPGVGKVKPVTTPATGRLQPLKRGGTVKRNT